ncbi:integrase catalytic domain-containing protein [Trichonephila clavipes]|nr:integrase catalytic domain-containing protein [Trichonephila clavipes]
MEEWMNFYQKLAKVNNFKIPRCILLPSTIRIEIHGFSDASERAYAAVVYIKCFNESGQSQTRLLCSKSRVAPLKTLTIPRNIFYEYAILSPTINFVVLIAVLYNLLWFINVNEQNIKKWASVISLLKEDETDQAIEEPDEIMRINRNSESKYDKSDRHETFELNCNFQMLPKELYQEN